MKIALLGNNYPPEFRGGTERVMQALARELHAQGDEVVVICGSEQGIGDQEIIEAADNGTPVFRIPLASDETYGVNVPRPRIRDHVHGLLQQHQVDLLHVHHWSHTSDGLLQMARAEGIAGLCTLHDMWTSCVRFFRQPPAKTITCPSADGREPCIECVGLDHGGDAEAIQDELRRRDHNIQQELAAATAVTAPSESCAAAIKRHVGFDGPIEVIPHGLLANVARNGSSEDPSPRRRFRVGTFGNLGPEKGVTDLLHAMSGVHGAELCIFGHCPDSEYPIRLAAEAAILGVTVDVHGAYDDRDDVHPADQMDLAVFFSHCEETYGLVVEEALARGKPVIVSDRGALPERTRGGGGVIVGGHDIAVLRHRIQHLVQDQQAYRQLRDEIPRTFATIADAAARYRALYADAVS